MLSQIIIGVFQTNQSLFFVFSDMIDKNALEGIEGYFQFLGR